MIKSFADKETEKIYNQTFSKKLPQSIQRIALRKLIMLDNACCLENLRVPPSTVLNCSTVIGKDNTAFGSMISFASASELKGTISSALK